MNISPAGVLEEVPVGAGGTGGGVRPELAGGRGACRRLSPCCLVPLVLWLFKADAAEPFAGLTAVIFEIIQVQIIE